MLRRKVLQVSSPQGRFLEGAALLDGRRCMSVEACGKHLFYRFAGGDTLHIHLGLFGKFRSVALPAPVPRGLVRVRLESPTHCVDCNGPNQCEVLDKAEADPVWRTMLTRAAMEVRFPIRSVLAEPVVPLQTLIDLKPGDVIPISFGPDVPVMVGRDRLGTGTVGTANGRAAVRLTRLARFDEGSPR